MTKALPKIDVTCPGCGNVFQTNAGRISRGRGKHCSKACSGRMQKMRHGHAARGSENPTYWSWANMVQRCTNPKAYKYPQYGGAGITVCDRWKGDYAAFLADMGERPKGMTIDRIDGTKGYYPGNCRWATPEEQSGNLKTTSWVDYKGERITMSQLSKRLGISKKTLFYRVKQGWPDHRLGVMPKYRH